MDDSFNIFAMIDCVSWYKEVSQIDSPVYSILSKGCSWRNLETEIYMQIEWVVMNTIMNDKYLNQYVEIPVEVCKIECIIGLF
jgi:hypothetical protein